MVAHSILRSAVCHFLVLGLSNLRAHLVSVCQFFSFLHRPSSGQRSVLSEIISSYTAFSRSCVLSCLVSNFVQFCANFVLPILCFSCTASSVVTLSCFNSAQFLTECRLSCVLCHNSYCYAGSRRVLSRKQGLGVLPDNLAEFPSRPPNLITLGLHRIQFKAESLIIKGWSTRFSVQGNLFK